MLKRRFRKPGVCETASTLEAAMLETREPAKDYLASGGSLTLETWIREAAGVEWAEERPFQEPMQVPDLWGQLSIPQVAHSNEFGRMLLTH